MRKNLLNIFLTLLIAAGMHYKSMATHSMGADLTYECVGGNNYKIRVAFYRDCIGINAPNSVNVTISSASCGQRFTRTLFPVPGTGQEITPLCPNALSTCKGGVFTGIQEWVYERVVTLPAQCTDWTFSYELCCRNAAINTITNPLTNTFYIYATLNNTISPCNTSPVFSNKPVPFACLGQELCFNHGASDADGDSLVYELITPKQNDSTDVSYIPPFSASNPLTSSPSVYFNTSTGDICMTPTQLDVTVMAVLVKEYRNGVLIGTVERDIQVTVINCNNTLPTLSGINGTDQFSDTICANQPYCFNVYSNDPDVGQNLTVVYDSSVTGATFTTAGTPHPTGTFCWTPTNSDISGAPRCFTIKVTDDNCPWLGSQIYSYCLTVVGVNVNAGPDQSITCSDLATVTATASGGTGGPYTYQWSNGFTNPTQTVGPGTYIVTVSDGMCSATDTVVIQYISFPTAAFTASSACLNQAITFTDQSTVSGSSIIDWFWDFGDGNTATVQNPIHLYDSVGTYNVMLVVTTNLGCIDTIIQPVTINPLPVPAFTLLPGCAGTAVTLTNNTLDSVINWNWNFGNGQVSTQQNPTIVYSDSGTYNVSVTITDIFGCTGTANVPVTIEPAPVAAFTFTGPTCIGDSFLLSNTSTGNIIAYLWNFGGTDTSNLQNPIVSFTTPGVHPVTLTVTSANGCISTYVQNITISSPPVANAGADAAICLGQSVTLTASGGLSYQWSNGQYTNPVNVSPSQSTTYTVTVTDVNGCVAVDSVLVNINQLPVAVVSPPQSICFGDTATLTASGGVSYSWSPVGLTGSVINVNPNSSSVYTVLVTDNNGCTANAQVNVTVNSNPVVNIPTTFVCTGTFTTLNAGNAGSSYLWSTGDTTQTIDVTAPGNYAVTVINSFGCSSTDTVLVTPGGSITNNQANISMCQGLTATLDAGNPGNSFLWSTGAVTQTITVSSSGQYAVTITNLNGCTATLISTVQVNPLPSAAITINDACINQAIQFFDSSSISAGNISNWQWSFGDSALSNVQNPTHNFANAGTYNISLVVTSAAGCMDSISQSITIFPKPVVAFSGVNACPGSAIQFQNSSSVSTGSINAYHWNFGDGTTSSVLTPTHTYTSSGNYQVALTVNSSGGCVDSLIQQVTIYPKPVAQFTAPAVCLNQQTNFNNQSTVNGNNINAWSWNFGNGNVSNVQSPAITYMSPGVYNVQLIVQTAYLCSDTIVKPITIHALPIADAGVNQSVCLGNQVVLTASGGSTYNWTPVVSNSNVLTITPLTTQAYFVHVTDSNNCAATDSVVVTVLLPPIADAGVDKSICKGSSTTLTATGGGSYIWMPTSQTSSAVTVSPANNTMYAVVVTAPNGCTATDSVLVTVNPLPMASAGPNRNICENQVISFSASGGVSYLWYPTGDTTATIMVNPATTSAYIVEVTDINGCKAMDTMIVTVFPRPIVNLTDTFVCIGYNATLDAGNAGSIFQWIPNGETTQTIQVSTAGSYGVIVTAPNGCTTYDDAIVTVSDSLINSAVNVAICSGQTTTLNAGNAGSTYLWSTGATTASITVASQGTYTVTVTGTDGCSAIFNNQVNVNPLPLLQFTASPLCFGSPTQFVNQSSITSGNINSFYWSFGDGMTDTSANTSYQYPLAGTYAVSLIATSTSGCVDSLTQQVTVHDIPNAKFAANNVCKNIQTTFNDQSSVANGIIVAWDWDFGDGASSQSKNPLHTYASNGIYPVDLRVTSNHGCSDLYTDTVEVFALPQPQIALTSNCINIPVSMIDVSDTSGISTTNWQWNFGDGNFSTSQSPVHSYANAGNYMVTLQTTNSNGCIFSDTTYIDAYPNPVASFTGGPGCEGTPVTFNNSSTISSGSINGFQWLFGDSSSSQATNPEHTFTPAGNYVVTLIATSDQGCIDSTQATVVIHQNPVAQFQYANHAGCGPLPVQFYDYSQSPDGNIVNWDWSFGDGNADSVQNPLNIYTQTGVYNVVLTVTSQYGCVNADTALNAVTVYPNPIAGFTPDPHETNILNPVINFINQSIGAISWDWTFGDGHSSDIYSPTHAYGDTGWYNVSQIVVNSFGCRDSAFDKVYIAPITTFYIPNAFTPNNDGTNEEFDIKGINILDYTLLINDRWGELIFEGDNKGWDGRVKGKSTAAKQDVYVYTVVAKDVFGKYHKLVGHVTLLR